MSLNHKVFYKGNMIKAKQFVNKIDGVSKIPYNKEILYNILLHKYDKVLINNLICETLDPETDVAKLYLLCKNKSSKETQHIIKLYNSKNINALFNYVSISDIKKEFRHLKI